MSPVEEEFDWSFLGAVIVISLATFALIISVAYYCWLYDVVTSVKYGVLAICGVDYKKTARRKHDVQILPVSSRQPSYPGFDRSNSENIELHVSTRVPQRPKQPNVLKRSNSYGNNGCGPQSGTARPTTANKRTRQRAVNIAIHELKSHAHDQREISLPVKPAKSETVRAYVKTSAVSTSSVVDTYSSTTISDNIDSDHETVAGLENESQSGVVLGTAHSEGHQETIKENIKGDATLDKVESFRTRKWSQINAKLIQKEPHILQVVDQMSHKPGRSTRAVAPHRLQNSEGHEESSSDIVNCTGRRGKMDAGSVYEVLQALRKSGNLGLNPVNKPVSRHFISESNPSKNSEQLISSVKTLKQFLSFSKENKEEAIRLTDNSSASDEIKSSSDTDSSLIVLSCSANFKSSSVSTENKVEVNKNEKSTLGLNNQSSDTEKSGKKALLNNQVESSNNSTLPYMKIEEPLQKIDPSKQVFGREDAVTPDIDKRESLVRRIDSLFCSTTPSSMGSVVSENMFEDQKSHNMEDNLNNLGHIRNQNLQDLPYSDPRSSSTSISASDNVSDKIPQSVFLTEPNIYESNEKDKLHNVKENPSEKQLNNFRKEKRHPSDSLSSSFNSTTLPSVTSDDINSTSTVEMTSEEDNDPGRLKFFH